MHQSDKNYLVGLSEQDILERKNSGLVNTLPEKITKSNWQIIKDNFCTLFNFYNFAIAVCLFLVSAYNNMLFIVIILVNIIIGIVQEIHAKNLVEELSLITVPKAQVMRAGKATFIPVQEIVLDDIIVFDSGKQISVDSIVLDGEIEVNESLLTGESDTVLKQQGDNLLSGSFVVSGKCYAQALHLGVENFAAKIAHEAKKHKQVHSELLSSMRKVTNFTSFLIIPLGALLFLEAYFLRDASLKTSVIGTSAALLGMLPKGLVLLISIALASGVIMLSRKKILVQELFALESLAHVDVLCLDKTGTITEGKMSVKQVFLSKKNPLPKDIETIIGCFLNNSDDNNATYLALKNYFSLNNQLTATNKIPFSSQRKWSSMTFEQGFSLVLGAPDRLSKEQLPPEIQAQEAQGGRILLAAYTFQPINDEKLPHLDILAYIVITDPVRKNAPETMAYFKKEGVEIKVISGDNPRTVSAIAKEAGLEKYDNYIDMSNLQTDKQISFAATNYTVFGRVSPHQKSKLIIALKEAGHTVAMTGDGVNDVLALRSADCSIALAEGSDAAKQVSKLVLLNSDFSSLLFVLEQGRRVVNNVTRVASIFFVKTIYSVLLTILCIFYNTPFPFIPLQIALIDLTIEGYPSFFTSFESDNKKITESFLHSVLRRAFPNALTIIINILIIQYLAQPLHLTGKQTLTVMYSLLGFIGIMAVIKSCIPFNKLRIFLCTTMTIGFFACIILFNKFLHLEILTGPSLSLFLNLATFSIILERIIAIITNKLLLGKASYKD